MLSQRARMPSPYAYHHDGCTIDVKKMTSKKGTSVRPIMCGSWFYAFAGSNSMVPFERKVCDAIESAWQARKYNVEIKAWRGAVVIIHDEHDVRMYEGGSTRGIVVERGYRPGHVANVYRDDDDDDGGG
eukprot:CAMPEP_0198348456 /NCGR_PEP_ID=MMETSP1450-20131203/89886_1 /TAXON_ID=753684 ORGANISM="Madagascaria erythrocladiodes, Strain CCMP3234" /NCGR_SAMPLE_ID=MMETSP1450 /ASSEMBLY_ACC=CAM_ASM_001115 /LENGTH=128 /DNA_ID=CAMNT_0044054079 /DNA_START=10 /DNA_END=393 /DNA_ORIENTATION=-